MSRKPMWRDSARLNSEVKPDVLHVGQTQSRECEVYVVNCMQMSK